MAADGNLTSGAARLGMSSVQQDYSKYYQADAAAMVGAAGSIVKYQKEQEIKKEKDEFNLNKYVDNTLLIGANGNELEMQAVNTAVQELVEQHGTASKADKKVIEAKIVNIGTKSKMHYARKLKWAEDTKTGKNLGGETSYDNDINLMVMQDKKINEKWGHTVTLDEDFNFVYTSDKDSKTVDSSLWSQSFMTNDGKSQKYLQNIASTLQSKGLKGYALTTTDISDIQKDISTNVIGTAPQLAKIINETRFRNADGTMTNLSNALKNTENVNAMLAAVTPDQFSSSLVDTDGDGVLEVSDFENGIESEKLQSIINNITKPYDPQSGSKNENYVGFEVAKSMVSGVLGDALVNDKYNPEFAKYKIEKNKSKDTQTKIDRDNTIGNLINIGQGVIDDQASQDISNLKGGGKFVFNKDGTIEQHYVHYNAKDPASGDAIATVEKQQITLQKMLDIRFGPGLYNANDPRFKSLKTNFGKSTNRSLVPPQ